MTTMAGSRAKVNDDGENDSDDERRNEQVHGAQLQYGCCVAYNGGKSAYCALIVATESGASVPTPRLS